MPDERTYGFNVDDATALLQSIGTEEATYQETRPRGGRGGGTTTILFEIVRVLRGVGLNCNAMECEVLNVSCGGSGVAVGDLVTVYDEIGCIFNAPEHLLAGLRGYAIRMGNPSYAADDPLVFEAGTESIASPTGTCRWCAQSTCCVEEE